jgi:hypothetical protein
MEEVIHLNSYLTYKGRTPVSVKITNDLVSVKSKITVLAEYASDMEQRVMIQWIFYVFKLPAHFGFEYRLSCYERNVL